jgi:PPOX class probable F420-dependent enzyme
MRLMTPGEYRAFLLDRPRTAKLATVRSDGRPHVAPVWFDLDGDDLVFTTWHTSVKAANLRRDPRVALVVDDEAPPFAFVRIDGLASLVDDAPDLRAWATRIAARYVGADQAEAFGARNGVPGELLVRVTPSQIVAQTEIAS